MTNIITQRQAVEIFVDISGQVLDAEDINYAEQEIGNPRSGLPITRTTETIDDFISSGWEIDPSYTREGIVAMKRGKATFISIADCGDYRLVYRD